MLAADEDTEFFKAKGYTNRGNGETKAKTGRRTKSKAAGALGGKEESDEPQKIISKLQVYKLGDQFLADAVLIGEHNQPYWITSESLSGQISTQQFIDITDDVIIDSKQKKNSFGNHYLECFKMVQRHLRY
jgi:hypothetical protein